MSLEVTIYCGRMTRSYPTVAKSVMKSEHFEAIGHMSSDGLDIDRSNAALAAWVAHDPKLMESPVRHRRPGR